MTEEATSTAKEKSDWGSEKVTILSYHLRLEDWAVKIRENFSHAKKVVVVGVKKWQFKWTVSQDFLLLVFFMNQFPPGPRMSH
jgi:hypothetical protein